MSVIDKHRLFTREGFPSLDNDIAIFIYAHNTIVDLNPYGLFIDRTLSSFYVKGDKCYYSLRVNRRENIPYGRMLHLLCTNQLVAEYINSHMTSYTEKFGQVSLDDFTVKINVQSEGPVQLIGPMKKALAFGLIVTALMGGDVKMKLLGQEFELNSDGIVPVLQEVRTWFAGESGEGEDQQLENVKAAIEADKESLELAAPEVPD